MEQQGTYRCEVCGREFETRGALEKHVHHTGLVE